MEFVFYIVFTLVVVAFFVCAREGSSADANKLGSGVKDYPVTGASVKDSCSVSFLSPEFSAPGKNTPDTGALDDDSIESYRPMALGEFDVTPLGWPFPKDD